MKKLYIVANFKSFKIQEDAKNWLEEFKSLIQNLNLENKEIIICPPFTLLPFFKTYLSENNLKIELGAQNVSPFDEGAYTGEVNAKQLIEFVKYSIVGHSERRKNFLESEEMLSNKTELLSKYNISPIFCVQEKDNQIPSGVSMVAYEPVFAIGTGNPDTPESADEVSFALKTKRGNLIILYGGSVNSDNVNSFTQKENISGVLVGGASLDVKEFIKIIQNS